MIPVRSLWGSDRRNIRHRLLLLVVIFTVLIFAAGSPAEGRVPHTWPEGWSRLHQLGRATRFVPRLAAAPDWDSQLVHLLWVADGEEGEASALAYQKLDLSVGRAGGEPIYGYSTGPDARITGFDFAADGDKMRVLWVEQREGGAHLLTGVFSPKKGEMLYSDEVFATDRSIRDPQVQVVDGELYFSWSDSAEGVLNVRLCSPGAQICCETPQLIATDNPSVSPVLAEHQGQIFLLWVERVGEAARQLRVLRLHDEDPDEAISLSYSIGEREPPLELAAEGEAKDMLMVARSAGRDRLFHLRLDEVLAMDHAEGELADHGRELLSAGELAGLAGGRQAGESEQLVWTVSKTDEEGGLSVFWGAVDETGQVRTQEMTPTVSATLSPVLFEDSEGNEHLAFLAVQPDMSLSVNYMNTMSPAQVVYWDAVGLEVDSPLPSAVSRLVGTTAMGLATMLPNVLPVMAAAVLIFAGGWFLPQGYGWYPGAASAAVAVLWRLLLPGFMYFDGRAVPWGDFWAAIILASAAVWFLLRYRDYDWRGDVLAVITVDFLWFWWFFTFTMLRI